MLEITEQYLSTKGFNNIYLGSMPDIDNCVGLFETTGCAPDVSFTNDVIEQRGLQIIVRNKSYLEGQTTINNIYNQLIKEKDLEVIYVAQHSPFSIGKDENNRNEFSVNFIVTKEG
jgi:hypothetical protein